MKTPDTWQDRAGRLRLHGLIAHWEEAAPADWVGHLLDWEETERARRSLERRLLGNAGSVPLLSDQKPRPHLLDPFRSQILLGVFRHDDLGDACQEELA